MRFPTTRTTLLKQLSANDESAWTAFFRAYQPVIRDVGVFKGLTPDECEELVQNTMIRFSRRVDEGFQYDASLARFRTYFNRIIKGCIYDLLRKRRPEGEVTLEDRPDENSPDELLDRLLLEKWRNFLLQQAQSELKTKVEAKTYQIFELFALSEGRKGLVGLGEEGQFLQIGQLRRPGKIVHRGQSGMNVFQRFDVGQHVVVLDPLGGVDHDLFQFRAGGQRS